MLLELAVPRKIALHAKYGVAEVFFVSDVVSVENCSGAVAAYLHRYVLGDAGEKIHVLVRN